MMLPPPCGTEYAVLFRFRSFDKWFAVSDLFEFVFRLANIPIIQTCKEYEIVVTCREESVHVGYNRPICDGALGLFAVSLERLYLFFV